VAPANECCTSPKTPFFFVRFFKEYIVPIVRAIAKTAGIRTLNNISLLEVFKFLLFAELRYIPISRLIAKTAAMCGLSL